MLTSAIQAQAGRLRRCRSLDPCHGYTKDQAEVGCDPVRVTCVVVDHSYLSNRRRHRKPVDVPSSKVSARS